MITNLMSKLLAPVRFRGKHRILFSLCPDQGKKSLELFGYKIDLDLSDFIQKSIYLNLYERKETALVKNYLKPGMTFIDVGANIGYYTLLSSSLVGREGVVLAFEPSPYAFDILCKTIKNNNINQARAIQAGLSDSKGDLQLYLPKISGNHTPSMIANEGGSPIKVPVLTLDEFLTENKIDHVDLMKVDVEGFEPNILKGAESYIRQGKVSAILCELNNFWLECNNSSSIHLHETLKELGYKTNEEFNPAIENQNLLFLRF